MNKILVSYFSASGTTKQVAETIANTLKADLVEIKPVAKYTLEDLNWNDKNSRSSKEMEDKNSRPAINDLKLSLRDYDKIVIGFPVWWYTAPRIINTFLEKYDFSFKKVYIFVTSGGSGVQESLNDLRSTYPNINFVKGKRFSFDISNEDIIEFIDR